MTESARILLLVLIIGSLAACGGSSGSPDPAPDPDPSPDPADVQVTLDPDTRHQTLEGFGASIAWYGDRLLNHPRAVDLQQVVFADLGLDILRLRNRYQRTNETVIFQNERRILDIATEALGREPAILMTSWSPPANLKANGNDDCQGNANCTLRRENGGFVYQAFAEYWRDSLEWYHSLNIVPDWISIQNEPNFIPTGWEGNRLTATEGDYPSYATALIAVDNALNSLENRPGLLGPETLGAHYNIAANYLQRLNHSRLAGVAHHLYERGNDGVWDWRDPGPDSYIEPMQTVVDAAEELPVFMTEFQTDEDEGIEGGFETAWLIHNSLVEANHVAWLYWDLIWEGQSGLVAVTANDYRIRDQYYALRHYSRYTDPGDQRIGATSSSEDVRVSAFMAPDGDRLTLVMLNVGDSEQTVEVDATAFDGSSRTAFLTTYDPGTSSTWQAVNGLTEDLLVTLPARSQITVVLE